MLYPSMHYLNNNQSYNSLHRKKPARSMKWMSYLMPVMFLFILNDYPSGLNYYYFISTLVSVVTTLIMRKTTNEEALLAQLEANKKDPKKMKKTGFAARLEAMQKQQEQMMKERQNKK